MKFTENRKETIKNYILDKISQNTTSVSKTVAEAIGVNPSTIHAYINELIDDHIIEKTKRDCYKIIRNKFIYDLKRSSGDLDNDMYALDKCLSEHISNFETNVISIWNYTFSEMINNVMDHSMAENVHISISQDYLLTQVMIYDDGIGIFNKIMDYFKLSSVDEAICELLKGKLTTDTINHSGEGIFFSSKLMDDFFIISSGKIFSNNKYDDTWVVDLASENQKGTLVVMSLSNHSNKIAKDIFDDYANVDGCFIKTRIPLKNIFDSAPVSRSQAKRVCNRLDKFKEVEIDFAEIPWMGQGFAHQIFVVFQNSFPEIKITPINMNEDTLKMYNHVKNT